MTEKPPLKCRPPKAGGRLLPPRLIITRSKTPPKHCLPPVRVSSHTHQQPPSCMASVSRQYSQASGASSPALFKCHSNPTSPNFLQPTYFEFDASSQHAPLRPVSASRFGRQSLSPSRSNSCSQVDGHLPASASSSTLLCRRSQVPQAQPSALQLGQKAPAKNGPLANGVRRQQWNKYFGVSHLEAPLTANAPRSKNRTALSYLGRSYTVDSDSGLSSFQGKLPYNMNAANGRDKGHAPIQSSLQRPNKAEDNGSPCADSSENASKEGESSSTKATMSPRALRAKLALLGESLSLDVQDSHVTGQDFGIRDYLSMTNESIDNEEESSLAGDFNVGLGIRPPRFSIDSLDSHMTMLLELNERKDTLQPLSSASAQASSSQSIRRNSEELGVGKRPQNGDAHNHGESNSCGPAGQLLRKSKSMSHAGTLPKIQEGSCTVIGTRAPLAQESAGAKSRDGQCVIRMASKQQRSSNLSRDKGTIEELEDDEDWKLDDCLVTYVSEIREDT